MRTRDWEPLFPTVGPVSLAALFAGSDGALRPPADMGTWRRELATLRAQRLSGLALTAAKNAGLVLEDDVATELQQAQLRDAARAMNIETTTADVISALRAERVPVVVTKGPGIADLYPQRTLRPFGDIDLLVPFRAFERAMAVVGQLGFAEHFHQEPRRYFNLRCREGVNLDRADGASIDLHHHIPPWYWGRALTFGRLHAAARQIRMTTASVPAASGPHNLLIVALHVVSSRGRPGRKLMIWRDLTTLASACDADAVVSEARETKLDWFLAMILRELPSFAQPPELLERLGKADPPTADRMRVRLLLPPSIGSRHQLSQAVRLPLPNALAFLAGYVVPSRAFLEERYDGDGSLLRWWEDAFGRLQRARSVDDELDEEAES